MAEVALMPAEQQVDALLELLTTVLNETSTEVVRQKRNQLMEHFANCGCSYETCSALLEMVDHHLALRERWAARQEAEARRAAKVSLRIRADQMTTTPLAAAAHRSAPGLRR
jgi:hypothetical protein